MSKVESGPKVGPLAPLPVKHALHPRHLIGGGGGGGGGGRANAPTLQLLACTVCALPASFAGNYSARRAIYLHQEKENNKGPQVPLVALGGQPGDTIRPTALAVGAHSSLSHSGASNSARRARRAILSVRACGPADGAREAHFSAALNRSAPRERERETLFVLVARFPSCLFRVFPLGQVAARELSPPTGRPAGHFFFGRAGAEDHDFCSRIFARLGTGATSCIIAQITRLGPPVCV